MRKLTIGAIVAVILAALLIILGGLILGLFPQIVKMMLKQQVPLKKGSLSEKLWKKPPFDIYMQFWIFNLTNAHDVLYVGKEPNYDMLGPYSYRESQVKTIQEYTDNYTVIYRNNKIYTFDKSKSCDSCDALKDNVIVPNIIYFTLVNMLTNAAMNGTEGNDITTAILFKDPMNIVVSFVLNALLGETPFVSTNVTVNGLTYDGYEDSGLDMLAILRYYLGINPLAPVTLNRMALFYGKNDTNDGLYEIYTGAGNLEDFGKIKLWNNGTRLNLWRNIGIPYSINNEECDPDNHNSTEGWCDYTANMINGTDGTLFPPGTKKTDTVRLFITDICRSILAVSIGAQGGSEYKQDVDTKVHSIPVLRFTVPGSVLQNSGSNRGFCRPGYDKYFSDDGCSKSIYKDLDGCLMTGFLDLSYGPITNCTRLDNLPLPLVISFPYYLGCPDCVRNKLGNYFGPEPREHLLKDAVIIDIEPMTGVGLTFEKRVQVNVPMHNIWIKGENGTSLPELVSLKPRIYPVLMLNESAVITAHDAKTLYNTLILSQEAIKDLMWVLIAIGIATLLAVPIGYFIYRFRLCPCGETQEDQKEGAVVSSWVSGRTDAAVLKRYHSSDPERASTYSTSPLYQANGEPSTGRGSRDGPSYLPTPGTSQSLHSETEPATSEYTDSEVDENDYRKMSDVSF